MLRTVIVLMLLSTPVLARDLGQWNDVDPETRAWYHRQTTTPETRERLKAEWYNSCCDHGDTVDAQFSKVNGQWMYRLTGTDEWLTMPQDIVQSDIQTPYGKPVLFVDSTGRNFGPICFFPGATGM